MLTKLLASLIVLPALANSATLEDSYSSVRFGFNDHLIFSSSKDANDSSLPPANLLMHENSLKAEFREYTLKIGFSNRLSISGTSDPNQPFVLEKKSAIAEWEKWDLKLGDSYQELGRGIALSLYRNESFGIDNTLEGVSVRYHPEAWELLLFAGRINALSAPVAIHALPNPLIDRRVWIAGTSVNGEIVAMKLGGHYFAALNQPLQSSKFDKQWHTGGITISKDNLLEGLDLYLESNILYTRLQFGDRQPPMGLGSYGSLVWANDQWKLKWETKDFRNYHFEFKRPPTLEEDIVETINTDNVSGTRLFAEHKFSEGKNSVHASYLLGDDREQQSTLHHGVVGTKWKGPWRADIELRTGYRWMPSKLNMAHGLIKGKLPTLKGQSVELTLRKQYSESWLKGLEDRNILDLTYTFSEKFNASFGYEYVPFNEAPLEKHFLNVAASLKWGALTSKAFIGQTSGGTLCSGGVCRQVPPYTGAMLETHYSF